MSLNKAILIGHLGKDPEVRYLPNGEAVANATLATSDGEMIMEPQLSNNKPAVAPSELTTGLGAFDVEAIIAEADAKRLRRAEKMPTEREALAVMFESYQRLRELGWREAIYAPRDGRPLELIEVGNTGIHNGYCRERPSSDFPTKWFWICDDDMWPSRPILFREPPNAE